MSYSPAAGELSRAHQQAQSRLGLFLALLLARLWARTFDPADPFDSGRTFVEAALEMILGYRRRSGSLAAAYVTNFRNLELSAMQLAGLSPEAGQSFGVPFTPVIPDPTPVEIQKLRRSLAFTGVGQYVKRVEQGEPPSVAADLTQAGVAGTGVRGVLDGGRAVIDETVRRDPVCVGYFRVTKSANPCSFCAMLASRGPVFQEDSFEDSDPRFTGPGDQKCHDHCSCALEPLYTSKAGWPGRAREWEALWKETGGKFSGAAARRAFRQAYEGRAA